MFDKQTIDQGRRQTEREGRQFSINPFFQTASQLTVNWFRLQISVPGSEWEVIGDCRLVPVLHPHSRVDIYINYCKTSNSQTPSLPCLLDSFKIK